MERMSTLDAGFFFVEHDNVPMHIGSVAVFEGPMPAYGDVVRLFESKLPQVPRYRQVVKTTPLQLFRPVWADDVHFEVGYHVRHAAVPAPGGAAELRNLAARLFAQRLDRARPLWEEWLLEGLEGGRWAIISKVHHAIVDGIGGTDLMTLVFDQTRDAVRPEPVDWEPEPAQTLAGMIAGGVLDAISWPLRQLTTSPDVLRLMRTPAELRGFSRGLAGSARRLAEPSAGFLNGAIGPHRRWAWTTASLADIKKIRAKHGGTVNDVLLTAITRAYRDLLEARGSLADGLVVRSLVPVSVRGAGQHNDVTNRVSGVLVNLPVGERDPLRRLALVREQMDSVKHSSQAVSAEILTGMLGFAAPMWLALGSRAAFSVPQPLVQTVTTNVPGPRAPLYLLGRRMEAAYPYVPIGNSLRTGVAIFSYLDTISFGITADYDAVPDLEILIDGIGRGLAELDGQPASATPATPTPAASPASAEAPKPRAAEKPGTPKRARAAEEPGPAK
jgi:diacylglycerol O-acyltransferase / wax synthase